MVVGVRDRAAELLRQVGLQETDLLAAHLDEIEEEANVVLDQLTAVRAFAYQGEQQAAQESLVELTIALRHLMHHAGELLPSLEAQLGIADEEEPTRAGPNPRGKPDSLRLDAGE